KIKDILEAAAGIDMTNVTDEMSFIEIGLDSLLLTQVALLLEKQFSVPVTFRQLNEELGRLDLLAEYLEGSLPGETVLAGNVKVKEANTALSLSAAEEAEIKKPFGAIARIDKQLASLGDAQQGYLLELTEKYNLKT